MSFEGETPEEAKARRERLAILADTRAKVEQAQKEAQEAAKQVGPSGEVLPKTPPSNLPPPEARKHVKVKPSQLEQKPTYHIGELFKPKKGKQPKVERREAKERGRRVRESRGAPVYTKRNPLESSGRISSTLDPDKAERLATLREYIRAFQNRKELHSLEKVWRRTRAQHSHDPELRP